ncbi:twin-arginine translocase subunit TatC [Neobacillus sp. NPDC093182]|uniref:twin-arginine translocase subunit TatC n=1 Tax=Neobacillus sp. NPDC093182 TaxID=3364297 RepID=UPI0037F7920A
MKKEVNFIEHLEELRKRIIITGLAFVIFLGIGLIYVKNIYLFFMGDTHNKLLVLGPRDVVKVYFQLSSIIAVAGTIPIASWQFGYM